MIATWMLYSITLSLLLALAAAGVDRALGRRLMPRRMVWIGGMLLSFGLSATAILWPAEEFVPPSNAPSYSGAVFQMTPVAIAETVEPRITDWLVVTGSTLEPALFGLWGFATALMLLYSAGAAIRLRVLRRRWGTANVRGRKVLVSRETGPAVVGFLASEIVMPQWELDGDPAMRDLMLAHEQEHLDAGDPKLLFTALALVALTPWNAPLSWQLRRLRLAIELDCDARVLKRGSDRKQYAALLLEVGSRRSFASMAVAAFARKPSYLERRIRVITDTGRERRSTSLAASGVAIVLLIAAAQLDRPTIVTPLQAGERIDVINAQPAAAEGFGGQTIVEEVALDSAIDRPRAQEKSSAAPAAPDTIPPPPGAGTSAQQWDTPGRMQNVPEVQQNLERFYPPLLREAGVGGTSELQMYVDANGDVLESRVARSAGHNALDLAAQRLATTIKFSPFKLRGENVGVWLTMPFTFDPASDGPAQQQPGNAAAGVGATPNRPLAAGVPPFPGEFPLAALSRPPALSNMSEVQQALVRGYPRELLDAGAGATLTIRLYIGADGRVLEAYTVSSTNAQFNSAAEGVARMMLFRPAEKEGEAVPVWIEMPVRFAAGT